MYSKHLISALYRILAGDVVPFKKIENQKKMKKKESQKHDEYDFKLTEKFLASREHLTSQEVKAIDKEIDRVNDLLEISHEDYDRDVIENLVNYLTAIENRLEFSMTEISKIEKRTKENLNKLKRIK